MTRRGRFAPIHPDCFISAMPSPPSPHGCKCAKPEENLCCASKTSIKPAPVPPTPSSFRTTCFGWASIGMKARASAVPARLMSKAGVNPFTRRRLSGCSKPDGCTRAIAAAASWRRSAARLMGWHPKAPPIPVYAVRFRPRSGRQEPRRKTPALRFIMPPHELRFYDAVAGPQTCAGEALSDFVVKRADGMFSYQLAVTVDDAAMGITDVLRGADLLDSTPRQLALYEALGLRAPDFAHVPLLVDASGRRLSKRDSALTLAALRSAQVPPERLLGALAHLAGWIDRPEPLTARELIPFFGPVRTASGRLTVSEQLRHWLTEAKPACELSLA